MRGRACRAVPSGLKACCNTWFEGGKAAGKRTDQPSSARVRAQLFWTASRVARETRCGLQRTTLGASRGRPANARHLPLASIKDALSIAPPARKDFWGKTHSLSLLCLWGRYDKAGKEHAAMRAVWFTSNFNWRDKQPPSSPRPPFFHPSPAPNSTTAARTTSRCFPSLSSCRFT